MFLTKKMSPAQRQTLRVLLHHLRRHPYGAWFAVVLLPVALAWIGVGLAGLPVRWWHWTMMGGVEVLSLWWLTVPIPSRSPMRAVPGATSAGAMAIVPSTLTACTAGWCASVPSLLGGLLPGTWALAVLAVPSWLFFVPLAMLGVRHGVRLWRALRPRFDLEVVL